MSRGLLTKNEHFGANCLNFFGVDPPKKIRRVCMEFSEYNWATMSETICPEMLIFLISNNSIKLIW